LYQLIFDVKYFYTLIISSVFMLSSIASFSQDRCGSMVVLERKFLEMPALRTLFNEREVQFQRIASERAARNRTGAVSGLITIPVVFHVVGKNQAIATDAQLLAQLDTLNKDYAGLNAGASKIPAHFQSLIGQSGIQFCLAQRTPSGLPTTGIERYATTRNTFSDNNENIKHVAQGGADAWDPNSYLNIWICDLGSATLGYATFPNGGPADEQGVVVHYRSLPGSSNTDFNGGKTLTHEIGHYFNLYHIWGDDSGSCSGTDRVEDTPNQGDANRTLRTGVFTDNCSPAAPGIMYQNFMDYSPDANLLMFTRLQVARMEAAFYTYRSIMSNSQGCTPVNLKRKDASIRSISQPDPRLCSDTFVPQVVLRNMGSEVLTTVKIQAAITGGKTVDYTWTGSLATYSETSVTLPPMQTEQGDHELVISSSLPNGSPDEDTVNDTRTFDYIYYEPATPPLIEGFEDDFPPRAWDIVNTDGGNTWEKSTSAFKTGAASTRIRNYTNNVVGQRDYLRSPTVNISGVDSAFVSFQVAAATYNGSASSNVVWDTLQVLVSTDCGKTYTSVYKKWGSTLITRSAATRSVFIPTPAEWRKERINISSFVPKGEVLLAFVNTNGNENDVYLDDINISTVTVNPNLKEAGFLVTPNPTDGAVSVQFYPHPVGLTGIFVYNASGQKVMERNMIAREVSTNVYDFNLQNYPAGLYIVKAVFNDRVLTKKIVKVN
jgi:hypothetical protein